MPLCSLTGSRKHLAMLLLLALATSGMALAQAPLDAVYRFYNRDMVDNAKANPAKGTEPNENYARELLQLFSIGTVELNADGTPLTDAKGAPVASYGQSEVQAFSRVFTGWTYAPYDAPQPKGHNDDRYFGKPMVPVASRHDTAAKTLLKGVVAPAGQSAQADLDVALANVSCTPTSARGAAELVTTFTLSDFNRTFRINANAGTDHAWGGPQLVQGGAVKGGVFYGRFPDLTMGGPDDASDYGAWIPTTSFDQYGATLARRFGVPSASLVQVFPALGAFPTQDLGFLG